MGIIVTTLFSSQVLLAARQAAIIPTRWQVWGRCMPPGRAGLHPSFCAGEYCAVLLRLFTSEIAAQYALFWPKRNKITWLAICKVCEIKYPFNHLQIVFVERVEDLCLVCVVPLCPCCLTCPVTISLPVYKEGFCATPLSNLQSWVPWRLRVEAGKPLTGVCCNHDLAVRVRGLSFPEEVSPVGSTLPFLVYSGGMVWKELRSSS